MDATQLGVEELDETGPPAPPSFLNSQALEMARSVAEEFGKRAAASLSAYLNLDVTADGPGALEQTFEEFLNSAGSPRTIWAFATAAARSVLPDPLGPKSTSHPSGPSA